MAPKNSLPTTFTWKDKLPLAPRRGGGNSAVRSTFTRRFSKAPNSAESRRVRACLNWRGGGSCLSLNVCLVEERATAPRGHKTLEQVMKSWRRDDRYNVTRRHRLAPTLCAFPFSNTALLTQKGVKIFSLKLMVRNSTDLSDTNRLKASQIAFDCWVEARMPSVLPLLTRSSDLKGGRRWSLFSENPFYISDVAHHAEELARLSFLSEPRRFQTAIIQRKRRHSFHRFNRIRVFWPLWWHLTERQQLHRSCPLCKSLIIPSRAFVMSQGDAFSVCYENSQGLWVLVHDMND